MSANKNAQLRYRILDRCLKDFSRMYGIDDLTDAVNESFLDLYGTTISTRTIRKDLNDLQDRMSFNAPIKIYRNIDNSCYYRYTDPDFELFSDNIDNEDVENILVLQNWLERIRKEVTNKVLSIKRISDFLIFPILAQPTLKKI